MSRRNNVNPDHYKVAGRLRPDDLASAQFSRAISAKTTSQQRPDRMGKGLYFERAESEPETPAPAGRRRTGRKAGKKAAPRAGAAKRTGARKATKAGGARRTTSRKASPRKATTRGKRGARKRK